MSIPTWNLTNVKAQLRVTAQRLGQLEQKKASKGNITRRDISTLLQQGNVGLARAKARNLIFEDASEDLLEALVMQIGIILEHIDEIDARTPSPRAVEAISSIIFAAPHTESRDLYITRQILVEHLPDLSISAMQNRDNHVPSRIIRALSDTPPSASALNYYLLNIATAYGVQWRPELSRQNILLQLSEILDPTASPVVDLARLRKLCARGLPNEPAWLRPRVWKLFFGTLPMLKSSWQKEPSEQRESYYELIRRLVAGFSEAPPPTNPLSAADASLMAVFKQFSRIPQSLFSYIEDEPEPSAGLPSENSSSAAIMNTYGGNLDARIRIIQEFMSPRSTQPNDIPEIRLEGDEEHDETPSISLTEPDSSSTHRQNIPTTLLPSRAYGMASVHEKHASAIIRLLFLHSSINPANHSPHIPSLIVPIYSVLMQEIEPEDLRHVEADTFWLFEAMIAEFSQLEEEDGAAAWMRTLSDRVRWADNELSEYLQDQGLDPALPHYSYRWLGPLLTQTLPVTAIFPVWDALFACSRMERDRNPKLEHMTNICTAMLLHAKNRLVRFGSSGAASQGNGLWITENHGSSSPSTDLGDGFLEGMSLLQQYPVDSIGGVDIILQTASDLAQQREAELRVREAGTNMSLGARLWKGFGSQPTSTVSHNEPPTSEYSHIERNPVQNENPAEAVRKPAETLGTRLATTVWKGITNESSMNVPPTPISPTTIFSARAPPLPEPTSAVPAETSTATPGIWSYADKLKDSDTAAVFAKVSSNWRARAMGTWLSPRSPPPAAASAPVSPHIPSQNLSPPVIGHALAEENRRGSLPIMDRPTLYSPPARPAFFQSPRDSIIVNTRANTMAGTIMTSPESISPPGLIGRATNMLGKSKAGPRPLLLNSSSLITPIPSKLVTRSATSTPSPERIVSKRPSGHLPKDSQSSASSFERHSKSRSDWESDSIILSRKIPLNRRSISPMAPVFTHGRRPTSASSSASSDRGGLLSPILGTLSLPERASPEDELVTPQRPWGRVELQDSPALPLTPVTIINNAVRVTDPENDEGAIFIQDVGSVVSHVSQKRSNLPIDSEETSDSSMGILTPSKSRSRQRRYPTRPANLRIDSAVHKKSNSLMVESPLDHDAATTPRATTFDGSRPPSRTRKISTGSSRSRKLSSESKDAPSRSRKISSESRDAPSRSRKISSDSKDAPRRVRDSHAADGDDEYDDLLSAYESEI